MLTNFLDRVELLEYIENNYKNGIGVEIGVFAGHFSKQILATWKSCKQFYCVDLWAHQENNYIDGCNQPSEKHNETYAQIQKDFANEPRVNLVKNWSHIACTQFEDNFFDFIYIDANHSYKGCLQDLNLWYPKLKEGGIMGGHDYLNGPEESYGVIKAVDQFVEENKIELFKTIMHQSRKNALYGISWEGISYYFKK